VRQVADNDREVLNYDAWADTRKKIEDRIFSHLEEALVDDPKAFFERYVFKSCHGQDAQEILPALLDAYWRITQRAVLNDLVQLPWLNQQTGDDTKAESGDWTITLLSPRTFRWLKPRVIGNLTLKRDSIEKVVGTPKKYFVATDKLEVTFKPDHVSTSERRSHRDGDWRAL